MFKAYVVVAVAVGIGARLAGLSMPWCVAVALLVPALPAFLVGALRGATTPSHAERPAAGLAEMSGTDFEDHVARIARGCGVPVIMTPLTGDWGVDLIVGSRPNRLAIQCKRQARPVGAGAVQESSRVHRCRTAPGRWSSPITNFTSAARKLAELHGCVLVGGIELTQLGRTIRRLTGTDAVNG